MLAVEIASFMVAVLIGEVLGVHTWMMEYARGIFTFAYSYSSQSFSVLIVLFYSCWSMVLQKFCNRSNRLLFSFVFIYFTNFSCISHVYMYLCVSINTCIYASVIYVGKRS